MLGFKGNNRVNKSFYHEIWRFPRTFPKKTIQWISTKQLNDTSGIRPEATRAPLSGRSSGKWGPPMWPRCVGGRNGLSTAGGKCGKTRGYWRCLLGSTVILPKKLDVATQKWCVPWFTTWKHGDVDQLRVEHGELCVTRIASSIVEVRFMSAFTSKPPSLVFLPT